MKKENEGLFLHIGCGLDAPAEWLNVDSSVSLRWSKAPFLGKALSAVFHFPKWPASARGGDVVKGLRLRPGSCSLVYASHVLEHLSLKDFHSALKNIHSYLKPEGIFRAVLPDLEISSRLYLRELTDENRVDSAAAHLMENLNLGCAGSRRGFFERLREAFGNSRHQWMWDWPSLSRAFREHGFKNIRRYGYGERTHPAFAQVEKKERFENSLAIEAVK